MKISSVSFKKTLVIGIIVLFLGVGVQPAIATVQPKEDIICNSPHGYLFKFIIDFVNNPEVANLIDEEITLEVIESAKVTNKNFIDTLKEAIKKDDILSDRINNLQNMFKEEMYQINPSLDSPLLHIYIIIVLIILIVVLQALGILNFFTNDKFIVFVLIEIVLWNIYWEYFHDLMDQE
jgi:hypothetical protein